jgi:xylulose-5-phosphate/fructose-6-phosphate phosphoketolase
MVVLNNMSRYHLAIAALERMRRTDIPAADLIEQCRSEIESAVAYARTHFDDRPDIRDWVWSAE